MPGPVAAARAPTRLLVGALLAAVGRGRPSGRRCCSWCSIPSAPTRCRPTAPSPGARRTSTRSPRRGAVQARVRTGAVDDAVARLPLHRARRRASSDRHERAHHGRSGPDHAGRAAARRRLRDGRLRREPAHRRAVRACTRGSSASRRARSTSCWPSFASRAARGSTSSTRSTSGRRAPHDRRPFFVFVNLFEAHEPYRVRATNPFLPPGANRRAPRALRSRRPASATGCRRPTSSPSCAASISATWPRPTPRSADPTPGEHRGGRQATDQYRHRRPRRAPRRAPAGRPSVHRRRTSRCTSRGGAGLAGVAPTVIRSR